MFGMLGVWLAAASAIDPAAIRLGYPLPSATAFAAASLIIVADGLFCAGLVARVHERRHQDASAGRVAAWMQPVVNAVLALLAGGACVVTWCTAPVPVGHDIRLLSGFILVLGAFPALVLERTFAGMAAWELAFMLRVPLLALLGVGIAELLLAADFAWPGWIEQAVGILVLLVSIELLLRSFAMAFAPPPRVEDLRPIACSVLARAIRPARPTLFGLNAALKRQVGIDLQRSWALGFAARAAVPIALGIAVLAWGVTGLTALRLDQRAVYERLGVPVAVLGPGLHLHLPWPFGIFRPVELGVLHDVPASFEPVPTPITQVAGAEDEPPPSDDRLWDGTHPGETTYLIASEEAGEQGFQIVDVDLRLIWRIGLSDEAALQAVANDADPGLLVRSVCRQILLRNFANRSLEALLAADRETLAATLRRQMQQKLDALRSGIDLVAVVIEAIHPPPAAAGAYHAVQAAGIRAEIAVADQTGQAADSGSLAQQTVAYELDAARGQAAATLGKARGDAGLFAGDQQAYQVGGQAFLLERWFSDLTRALGDTELLIVDHRLAGGPAPTIDLRPPLAPGQTLPRPGQPHHPQSEPY
jgi:regulator of protease activity HflC (stomatin/prohibitin superfamily)